VACQKLVALKADYEILLTDLKEAHRHAANEVVVVSLNMVKMY
jgi:hypothetical protein